MFRKNRDIKSKVRLSKDENAMLSALESSPSTKKGAPFSPFKNPDKVNFETTNFLKPYDPHVRTELMDEDVKQKLVERPPKLVRN